MSDYPPEKEHNVFIEEDDKFPDQYQEDTSIEPQKLGEFDFDEPGFETDEVEVKNPLSAVASAPAKNILILGVLIIGAIFFLYKYVFVETPQEIEEKKLQQQVEAHPVEAATPPTKQEEKPQVNIGVVETPELPAMENIQPLPMPTIPEDTQVNAQAVLPEITKQGEEKLQVPPPVLASIQPLAEPVLSTEVTKVVDPKMSPEEVERRAAAEAAALAAAEEAAEAAQQAKLLARRKTGMLVMNGGGTPKDVLAGTSDPGAVGPSSAEKVTATKVEDLTLMILQGKMIDAVLETTINTDLPGSLRAVISRDIYAESGKNILIPRASRLIGTYNNTIESGQQRVIVTWGRVIRPDGVDIKIDSGGTDQLGRAGMTGIVDNKYFELFSNSLLVSALTIGGSIAIDKVQDSQTTTSSTTTETDGTTTSTSTGGTTDSAVLQATQNLTDTLGSVAKGYSTQPTIIVNQGARIKVFVNKDLIFPESVANKGASIN